MTAPRDDAVQADGLVGAPGRAVQPDQAKAAGAARDSDLRFRASGV